MYKRHKMTVSLFDDQDVFTDLSLASDADEDGGGSSYHSLQPDRSDY